MSDSNYYIGYDMERGTTVGKPQKLAQVHPRCGFSEFFLINQKVFFDAVQALHGTDFKILALMMQYLDKENYIHLSQADIAKLLGMQHCQVGRSVRKLLQYQILFVNDQIGKSKYFRLNPYIGWKGSGNDHWKVIGEVNQRSDELLLYKL